MQNWTWVNILTKRNYLFGKTRLEHDIGNGEQKIMHNVIQRQRNLCDYLPEQTHDYNLTDCSEELWLWKVNIDPKIYKELGKMENKQTDKTNNHTKRSPEQNI